MAIETVAVNQRVGTAAEWAASSLVLARGERGVNSDTGEVRVGDGTNTWTNLTSEGREGTAVLVGGTVTVNRTDITAKTIAHATCQILGTVARPQGIGVHSRVNGTSITFRSTDATDTSTIGYSLVEGP
jgi:hypothetical protein